MTTHPEQHLHLTTVDSPDSIRIEIHGDLDHVSAGLLVEEATAQLAARPSLADLHLHCANLGVIDSMGLSALLMIHRRTTAAGVRLHMEDRPATLDRILHVTGTFDYLTAAQHVSPAQTTGPDDGAHAAPSTGRDSST
ncbi:STAS domain-containing protein [Streptomyces sp. NPDC057695]|uniref:STAS domain-containing protein n=1 Tax=Streptomyces sp. NPDC057695 TaxID=3346217 RepID=UPI0036BC20DF